MSLVEWFISWVQPLVLPLAFIVFRRVFMRRPRSHLSNWVLFVDILLNLWVIVALAWHFFR